MDETRLISLPESLRENWLKLPCDAVKHAGPASQTLAGIMQITNRETYCSAEEIANRARVPLATCRKHLAILADRGYIDNEGRQSTRAGIPRRTCTIRLTKQARDMSSDYYPLPWWAACYINRLGRLKWSTKALLSLIMRRLMGAAAWQERNDLSGDDDESKDDALIQYDSDDRYKFSLAYLSENLGLTRESVVNAKADLARMRIIDWCRGNGINAPDTLTPSLGFRVSIKPAGPGLVTVSFTQL